MFACISIVDNIDIFKKKSVKVIPADEMQYQAVDNKNVSSLKVNILKQVLFYSPNFSFSVLKMPHTAVEFKLQFTRALTKSNMKSFNLDCYIVFTFERYCPNCCGAQSVCIAMLNV